MTNFFLQEIYGLGDNAFDDISDLTRDREIQPFLRSDLNLYNKSVKISKDLDFYPLTVWQQFFADRILKKSDTFMTVPPGAGKTNPILLAWFIQFLIAHNIDIDEVDRNIRQKINLSDSDINRFFRARNSEDFKSKAFPRLLYIGRTKQLAGEAFSQNIRGNKDYGLINIILNKPRSFGININNNEISQQNENQILDLINRDLLGISAGSIRTDEFSSRYKIKSVYISTPSVGDKSKLLNLIRSYGDYFNTIIIDESQDYMIKPNEEVQSAQDSDMFKLYIDIIRLAPPPGKCGVHLLSGTTNYQTASQLIKDLNICYKRNFEMPAKVQNISDPNDKGHMFFSTDFDMMNNKDNTKGGMPVFNPITGNNDTTLSQKFAGNRSMIKVLPYDLMDSFEQKKKLLIDIVNADQKNSVIVIFSVDRASKNGIFRIMEKTLPFLPARDESELYSKKEKIAGQNMSVNDMKKQYSGDFVPKNSYNPKSEPARNKGDIFSSSDSKINLNDLDPIQFLKHFDVVKSEQGADEFYSEHPNPNNIVFQAALRGIGIMIGKSDNRHKEIIQKLFRDGKLTVLLATDSLGINTKCH
jgi:hypothetical protein